MLNEVLFVALRIKEIRDDAVLGVRALLWQRRGELVAVSVPSVPPRTTSLLKRRPATV